MITDQEGIHSAVLWGIYCAIAAFLFSFVGIINVVFSFSETMRFLFLAGFLLTIFFTMILHTRGYVYLGNKIDSRLLKWSAVSQCVLFFLLSVSILTDIVMAVYGHGTGGEADAFIGLFTILLFLSAIFFAYSMIRLYKHIGVLALLAAPLPFWFAFLWYGWPIALFLIPSVLFLAKAENTL